MHRRSVLVLTVAALIALSGCSAVLENTQTFGGESELNATAVVDGHLQGLQDAGTYTASIAQRTEQVGEDAVPNRQDVYETHTVNLDSNTKAISVELLRGGTGLNNTGAIQSTDNYYTANETRYTSRTRFNTTQYDISDYARPVSADNSAQANTLTIFLSSMRYEQIAEGELNGTTFYRYNMTGITDMQTLAQTPDARYTNTSSELIIGDDGVVRSIQFSGTRQTENGSRQIRLSTSYDGIGTTTVQEPSWVQKAVNSINASVSYMPDADEAGSVTVKLDTLDKADAVLLESASGEVLYQTGTSLSSEGDLALVRGLSDGDSVTVIGEYSGERSVVDSYVYEGRAGTHQEGSDPDARDFLTV